MRDSGLVFTIKYLDQSTTGISTKTALLRTALVKISGKGLGGLGGNRNIEIRIEQIFSKLFSRIIFIWPCKISFITDTVILNIDL